MRAFLHEEGSQRRRPSLLCMRVTIPVLGLLIIDLPFGEEQNLSSRYENYIRCYSFFFSLIILSTSDAVQLDIESSVIWTCP